MEKIKQVLKLRQLLDTLNCDAQIGRMMHLCRAVACSIVHMDKLLDVSALKVGAMGGFWLFCTVFGREEAALFFFFPLEIKM